MINILVSIGFILMNISWIPQIANMLKTKTDCGLNPYTLAMIFIGLGLVQIYNLTITRDLFYICGNGMAMGFIFFILILKYKFGGVKC